MMLPSYTFFGLLPMLCAVFFRVHGSRCHQSKSVRSLTSHP